MDDAADEGSERDRRLTAAIRAHASWRIRLEQAIATGQSSVDVATAQRDDACPFGKWLYTEIDVADRGHPQYETTRDLHTEFHLCAASVLDLALKGRQVQAREAIGHGRASSTARASS